MKTTNHFFMKTTNHFFNKLIFSTCLSLAILFSGCKKDDDNNNDDDPIVTPVEDPCEGVEKDVNIVSDFDCQRNHELGWGDFSKEVSSIIIAENPSKSGINTSDSVGLYTDNGTDAWDNAPTWFEEDIENIWTLSKTPHLKFKVYASKAVSMQVNLEGSPKGENLEVKELEITKTNEWEEITVDLSQAIGKEYTKFIFFFNAGKTDGTEKDIYYIDDIRFVEAEVTVIDPCEGVIMDPFIINDFECQKNVDLSSSVTGASNPTKDAVNDSDNIGAYTNPADEWSNITAFDAGDGNAIDLSTNNVFRIKVLTTSSTGDLMAKLDEGTSAFVQIRMPMSDKDAGWVEYSFNFSSQASENHQKLFLFFNAEVANAGTDIYYIDDLRWETGGPETSATAPTQDEADVISVFSDAFTTNIYTDYEGWNANLVFEERTIGTDNIWKLSGVPEIPIIVTPSDVTSKTHLHFDVWVEPTDAPEEDIIVKLFDWANGDANAKTYTKPSSTGSWVAYDVLLSDFTAAGSDLTDTHHIALVFGTTGTVYVDNIYFY